VPITEACRSFAAAAAAAAAAVSMSMMQNAVRITRRTDGRTAETAGTQGRRRGQGAASNSLRIDNIRNGRESRSIIFAVDAAPAGRGGAAERRKLD